jgi:hypothetical protein
MIYGLTPRQVARYAFKQPVLVWIPVKYMIYQHI